MALNIGDKVVISGGGENRPTGVVNGLHTEYSQHGHATSVVSILWRSGTITVWPERDVILESDWVSQLGYPTWVVWNVETGWSDESMRFGTRSEAVDFIESSEYPEMYAIRFES